MAQSRIDRYAESVLHLGAACDKPCAQVVPQPSHRRKSLWTRKSKTKSMGDRRSMRLHKCTPLAAISQTLFEIEASGSTFLLETMAGKETRARA
jgi:hypothetical protein